MKIIYNDPILVEAVQSTAKSLGGDFEHRESFDEFVKNYKGKLQILDNTQTLLAVGDIQEDLLVKPKKVFIRHGK